MSIKLEFNAKCDTCGREVCKRKIFPRKNYERFAKNIVLKCEHCNSNLKFPQYTIIESKFFVKGNYLFIKSGENVKEIAELDDEKIRFNLAGIRDYLGSFILCFGNTKLIETYMDKNDLLIDFDDKMIKQFNKVNKNVRE